jgi:RDD family.
MPIKMKKPMATKRRTESKVIYGGGFERFFATIIDTVLLTAVSVGALLLIYSWDQMVSNEVIKGFEFLVSYFLPSIIVIMFWVIKGSSPGKMVFRLRIVNASTLNTASRLQLGLRYFAYFASITPLMIGVLWIFVDKRNMAWHDKLSNTAIIKSTGKKQL